MPFPYNTCYSNYYSYIYGITNDISTIMDLYYLTDSALIEYLGGKLAELRIASNMTQAELSGVAGVGVSTVREAEKGGNISLAKLVRILRALGRLELLEPFFAPAPVSPIAAAKAAQTAEKLKPRKRVRK
jgi:DNA-binding XRE family transcriptional regulator